ncbi:hypothetical protein [Candidatus Leptofilum sp.]|uniref:hypothetical protein n=1 Tax=Candidatus Leptofilum sp. TaxID=3241576 RepID=UPI003B5A985C
MKGKLFIMLCIFIFTLVVGCGPSEEEIATRIADSAEATVEAIPARWEVEIISSEAAQEFDTWHFPDGSENIMVILTIEYTYHGQDRELFLPESITLVHTGTEGFSGWGRTASLYRAEGTSQIVDLTDESLVNYLDPGGTRTDTFVWEWPNDKYTEFRLFFPEIEAIDITFE